MRYCEYLQAAPSENSITDLVCSKSAIKLLALFSGIFKEKGHECCNTARPPKIKVLDLGLWQSIQSCDEEKNKSKATLIETLAVTVIETLFGVC